MGNKHMNTMHRMGSQLDRMAKECAVFAGRRPDTHRHQPKFDGQPVIWRGGCKYVVVARGKLVRVTQ